MFLLCSSWQPRSAGLAMPIFTPHQDAALRAASAWLKAARGRPSIFRLFGYAGTGKTTLAKHLAESIDGKVLFAAFTGKAACVMRSKGCQGATTIHSLIYKARDSGQETPTFELWDEAPASKAKLIIIDECSMVDAELARDLMSFGVPLLVLGDPAQLPPIQGGGFFTGTEPDAMLTEVHRHAQDDPIVRLWVISECPKRRRQSLRMRLRPDEEIGGGTTKVSVRPECFTGTIGQLDWPARKPYDGFDFGYVLTVHKAQGSQWDDVVLFDESGAFPESRDRWLYTGVTRAAKRLTLVV